MSMDPEQTEAILYQLATSTLAISKHTKKLDDMLSLLEAADIRAGIASLELVLSRMRKRPITEFLS